MNDSISDTSLASEPPTHPEGAIVVIARRGGESLNAALEALKGTSRAYGATVLVLTAGPPTAGERRENLARIRFLPIDPYSSEASWRAQALTETDADVVQFVDDATAAEIPWDEVTPLRLGIVRLDTAPVPDLRDALERLGVPEPAQLPTRKV